MRTRSSELVPPASSCSHAASKAQHSTGPKSLPPRQQRQQTLRESARSPAGLLASPSPRTSHRPCSPPAAPSEPLPARSRVRRAPAACCTAHGACAAPRWPPAQRRRCRAGAGAQRRPPRCRTTSRAGRCPRNLARGVRTSGLEPRASGWSPGERRCRCLAYTVPSARLPSRGLPCLLQQQQLLAVVALLWPMLLSPDPAPLPAERRTALPCPALCLQRHPCALQAGSGRAGGRGGAAHHQPQGQGLRVPKGAVKVSVLLPLLLLLLRLLPQCSAA